MAASLSALGRVDEALAIHQEILASPEVVAKDFVTAAALRRKGKHPEPALELARKALTLDPAEIEALRMVPKCLEDLGRPGEALDAYQTLLSHPVANLDDFADAGYLAAKQKRGDQARAIFQTAEDRFKLLSILQGWALINLDAPAEALAAFQRYETALTRDKKQPGVDLLAGLAIAHWLTGNKEAALGCFQRLVAANPSYGKAEWIASLFPWTEAEKTPLLACLAEAQRPASPPADAPKEASVRP